MVRDRATALELRAHRVSMRFWALIALCLALVAVAAFGSKYPVLVWNRSPSVPRGLYLIVTKPARLDDFVLIRLSGTMQALAELRGYIGQNTPLLKRVAAVEGDRVCRRGRIVQIGKVQLVLALVSDRQGRQLPMWKGCHQLQNGQLIVLGIRSDSFDSRYFGPLHANDVIGRAIPVWQIR